MATIGVHHVHGNALSLDQVAFRINGAVAVSPALYYLALYAISGARVARREGPAVAMNCALSLYLDNLSVDIYDCL